MAAFQVIFGDFPTSSDFQFCPFSLRWTAFPVPSLPPLTGLCCASRRRGRRWRVAGIGWWRPSAPSTSPQRAGWPAWWTAGATWRPDRQLNEPGHTARRPPASVSLRQHVKVECSVSACSGPDFGLCKYVPSSYIHSVSHSVFLSCVSA